MAQATEPFLYYCVIFKNNNSMKLLKIIGVNILILFSLLVATEFLLRISFPNFQLYKCTFPGQYNDRAFEKNNVKVSWPEKCDELGWVCKQDSMLNFSSIIYNKFQIIYRINKEGFRNRQDFSTPNNLSSEKKGYASWRLVYYVCIY